MDDKSMEGSSPRPEAQPLGASAAHLAGAADMTASIDVVELGEVAGVAGVAGGAGVAGVVDSGIGRPGLVAGASEIAKIALPSTLSMLSFTLMQFVDGLMVARIRPGGPAALTAQFSGGFASFILVSFFFGLTGMVSTFVSQNLGAGRLRQCGRYAWASIYIVLAASVVLLAVFLPGAAWLFARLGHAADVQALEVMYFRYMLAMTPVMLTAKALENYFFGLHRARLVFTVTVISNLLNLAGNYVLIFGAFGAPRLGLAGAAISTVAANVIYCLMFAMAFLSRGDAERCGTRDFMGATLRHVRDILTVGWPSGLQFFLDMFSWGAGMIFLMGLIPTVQGAAMPEASTIHLAASNVIMRYMHISFMPAVGLSIAAAAVVGRHIGAGRRHLAASRAWTAWAMGLVYTGVCGAAFFFCGESLMSFFISLNAGGESISAAERTTIVEIGTRLFAIAAMFQVFDATGIIMTGALKGAGDTLFPMVVSAIGGLAIGFGGGWLMLRFFPQLESAGIWLAGAGNIIFIGAACMARFVSGRWRRIDLLSDPGGLD